MDVEITKAVGYWSGQAEVQDVRQIGVMMCCQSGPEPASQPASQRGFISDPGMPCRAQDSVSFV